MFVALWNWLRFGSDQKRSNAVADDHTQEVHGDETEVMKRQSSIEHHFDAMGGLAKKEWIVKNVTIRHKFAEPQDVDLTIQSGGIGSHLFFMMSFRRKNSAQSSMVLDRSGRMVHATGGLALLLGTTAPELMARGAVRGLDSILPPPFDAMHRALITVRQCDATVTVTVAMQSALCKS